MLAFDRDGAVFMLPFVGMSAKEAKRIGADDYRDMIGMANTGPNLISMHHLDDCAPELRWYPRQPRHDTRSFSSDYWSQ
jgi:hypothetical protein